MDISKDNFQMLEAKCMIDKPVQCGSYSMSIVYFAAYTAVISLVAESGRLRPSAAACANSGKRGMGRLPRKCKLRGPRRVTVHFAYVSRAFRRGLRFLANSSKMLTQNSGKF